MAESWFARRRQQLMSSQRTQGALLTLGASVAAFLFALLVTSILLWVTGNNPFDSYKQMIQYSVGYTEGAPYSLSEADLGPLVNVINWATIYSLSAMAVAIGFRMALFNIGVEGQYRLAAMVAAVVGGAIALPPVLHQSVIIGVAMIVGGAWAGIAGLLKVTRGVSEVISTIMLNFIAFAIIDFLIQPDWYGVVEGNDNTTKKIDSSGQVGGLPFPFGETDKKIYGLALLSIAVGIGFWLLINRTRFGFDLRATGLSKTVAVASGVKTGRMVLAAMLLSGAVAGLVGMPYLLGETHQFTLNFPKDIGFTGIGIALLGRNKPVGIILASLLWAYLNESAQILDLIDVSKDITTIMQGVILLSAVVAYEVVHRIGLRRQQRMVGIAVGDLETVEARA